MKTYAVYFLLALLPYGLQADEIAYPTDLSLWKEAKQPPKPYDSVANRIWCNSARKSTYFWHVFSQDRQPSVAEEISGGFETNSKKPNFSTLVDGYKEGYAFIEVDDGWLVGFNEGEFGGAVYWFDSQGQNHYLVSTHQVINFLNFKQGIYAIEGHSYSNMSLIKIKKLAPGFHWQAQTIEVFASEPQAAIVDANGIMYIVLSDSIISINSEFQIKTIVKLPCESMPARSLFFSKDGKQLWVGMQQYVAKVDLESKKIKYLVPSSKFIYQMPEKIKAVFSKNYVD